jgi:putative aldouronate transport system substrate-binding protein
MKRTCFFAVIPALVFAVLAGSCKSKDETGKQAVSEISSSSGEIDLKTYLPLTSEPVTLRMFINLEYVKIGVHTSNMANLLCFQELEKRTGVKIEFIHPPEGMATEQLNLMIASSDLPDITHAAWLTLAGGAARTLSENVIVPINDYINKYPFLRKQLADDPRLSRDTKTDDGIYYCYPMVYRSKRLENNTGYIIRKDWLEKLNLPMPETIDEYYNTLVAFRDRDPNGNGKEDEIPMVSMYYPNGNRDTDGISPFYFAWGKHYDFYVKDNKVRFGAYEPEYKEYLLFARKLVAEGLLDVNFATADNVQFDALRLSNVWGLHHNGLGSGIPQLVNYFKSEDIIAGAPHPVLKKGELAAYFWPNSEGFTGSGSALSPKNKNNDIAAKWLDYCYSEDAQLLLNFGVEGQQYNMVDGYPRLIDDILHNPTMSINVALGRYAVGVTSFNFINDARVREQRQLTLDSQMAASDVWVNADNSMIFPKVSYTIEEGQERANIMSEVNTFVQEYTLGFILGKRDINREFDIYLKMLESMGIERVIEISQTAVDRYYAR